MTTRRLVHLISSDHVGGGQARHYLDHISRVRGGGRSSSGRAVEVRHSEAKNNHDLSDLLGTPASLTVFVGHSGRNRIGSEDHGWAWVEVDTAGTVSVDEFRTNGLILDTCGNGPGREKFQPPVMSDMAYMRCTRDGINRDIALVAYVLGLVTSGDAPALDSADDLHTTFAEVLQGWSALRAMGVVDLEDPEVKEAESCREWSVSLVRPANI